MARRLVVSDIHGQPERLQSVLSQASYSPDKDRLFLLGDYIDRGPDSQKALELTKSLVLDGAVALKGNHEKMMELALENPRYMSLWLHNGGQHALASFGGSVPDWAIDFTSDLPLYHEEPDFILVHAGLRPGVPLAEQHESDLLWIREDFILGYSGKTVVFGHTPTINIHGHHDVWFAGDKIGIDTGGVFGGHVTLMSLDNFEIWRS